VPARWPQPAMSKSSRPSRNGSVGSTRMSTRARGRARCKYVADGIVAGDPCWWSVEPIRWRRKASDVSPQSVLKPLVGCRVAGVEDPGRAWNSRGLRPQPPGRRTSWHTSPKRRARTSPPAAPAAYGLVFRELATERGLPGLLRPATRYRHTTCGHGRDRGRP
jgi:hypothetical protein